jgi:hypothetical protein
MTPNGQHLHVRLSTHDAFVVSLEIINRHRAEHYARHDADAGLRRYERGVTSELDYGREHPEILQEWVSNHMAWTELEPHARMLRESWRG